jgi:hypothetical protein
MELVMFRTELWGIFIIAVPQRTTSSVYMLSLYPSYVPGPKKCRLVLCCLVLGCLLALPDHHPVCVVQSGDVRTLPARQQESAKPWVGGCKKGSVKAVEQIGATGHQTLPTAMSVWNLGQLPRVLKLQAILVGGEIDFLSSVGREQGF